MDTFTEEMRRHGKWLVWGILLLILAGIVLLASLAVGQIKSYNFIGAGVQPTNTITVQGKGEVDAVPDIAQFTFGVSADGATPTDAQNKVTKTMNPIIDKLKGMGIDEKDIQTTDYQIYPKYEYQNTACPQSTTGAYVYCPPGKQTLVGYTESHTITVKVRDVAKAGDVIAAATSLGANNVSGISFVVDNQDAKMEEARRLAITDAKAKAQVLASDLGVRLVSLVSFSDSGNNFPIMYAAGAKAADMSTAAPAPEIPQGQNKITSNVSLVYSIQ